MVLRYICSVLVVAFCAFGALAADKPVVHWLNPHFPPVFMMEGPDKGKGYGDKIVRYIADRLPAYEHVILPANLNRMFAQMKQRDGVCSASLFRTPERDAFIEFSDDFYHVMTNRVVVMKDNAGAIAPYLNEKGEIDVTRLTAARHLSLGVVPGRFYSIIINGALEKVRDANNVVVIPFNRYGALLAHGRIHYTFGFAPEANYQFMLHGEPDAFTTFPIAGEKRAQSGGISCSDMPLGKEVIAKVNALIVDEKLSNIYDSYYSEWLDARSLKEYHDIRAAMPQ